jgi:hypothetical protein
MADIIDDGNETAELLLRAALAKKHKAGPEATGCCLNCETPLPRGLRWCDRDCRDDYLIRNPE